MFFPSKKNKTNQTILQTMISYWTGKKNPSWWPSLFLTYDKECFSLISVISLVCSCIWHMVSVLLLTGLPRHPMYAYPAPGQFPPPSLYGPDLSQVPWYVPQTPNKEMSEKWLNTQVWFHSEPYLDLMFHWSVSPHPHSKIKPPGAEFRNNLTLIHFKYLQNDLGTQHKAGSCLIGKKKRMAILPSLCKCSVVLVNI